MEQRPPPIMFGQPMMQPGPHFLQDELSSCASSTAWPYNETSLHNLGRTGPLLCRYPYHAVKKRNRSIVFYNIKQLTKPSKVYIACMSVVGRTGYALLSIKVVFTFHLLAKRTVCYMHECGGQDRLCIAQQKKEMLHFTY